jgi:hypothetical protein
MKRWIFFGIFCMTACKPRPLELETYHLQIKDIYFRIPAKYISNYRNGIKVHADRSCKEAVEVCAQHPPGLSVRGIALFERDFKTFEQYKAPSTGLSDYLTIDLDDPDSVRTGDKLPNFSQAWNPENRDATNDLYGLSAYKKVIRDDVNYRYDFESGEVLFMTCKDFNMPNPGCSVSSSWRGLTLRYNFRSRHLHEWRDLHERITNHFNSFVYQP